ncbi:hypothetical protein [Mucilaginibacter gynuensis]|uniref:hypothetical protein n=1 Tax=Mucilaginibacter gynuensis TaxID=1302236 RepID=UPI0031EE9028
MKILILLVPAVLLLFSAYYRMKYLRLIDTGRITEILRSRQRFNVCLMLASVCIISIVFTVLY